jgi:hypothetical protein
VIYISLLLCYPQQSGMAQLPGSRYLGVPADNAIPQFYAERLWSGGDFKAKYGDWLSSDRPPMEVGWILLCGAPVALLNGDFASSAQYAGIWMQLIWVAAAWAWLRAAGLDRRGAMAVLIGLIASGLFAFNTVYVWPKMAAAGLLLTAF